MKVHLTMRSANEKVGPIPVSTTTADSCPESCPLNLNLPEQSDREARRDALKAQGLAPCYASKGRISMHWRAVTEGKRGMEWGDFCAEIATLPKGTLWRHNQAGDLPGRGDEVDAKALLALADANVGRQGFTYTHKPVDRLDEACTTRAQGNLVDIARAVSRGFAVNLSADSLEDADRKMDAAESLSAPEHRPHVVCIVPKGHPERSTTPKGRPVVVCPEQTGKAKNCASCRLCARMDRGPIVAFRAH